MKLLKFILILFIISISFNVFAYSPKYVIGGQKSRQYKKCLVIERAVYIATMRDCLSNVYDGKSFLFGDCVLLSRKISGTIYYNCVFGKGI